MNSTAKPKLKLLLPHSETVDRIKEAFARSRSFLIVSHEHPDGDALGSSLALMHALNQQGKRVTIYSPNKPPEFYAFLPSIERITTEKPDVSGFDVLCILDSTQFNRTNLEMEALRHPCTIAIDHHHGNPQQATYNIVIPEAAATSHILFELFLALDIQITRDVATSLLTGIFTDTGSFMHDSVTSDILEMSSFLMTKGARLSHIAHETYQKKDLPALRIWGIALSRIITNPHTGASISIITHQNLKDCGATRDDLDGVVNMINTLPQTKFAMLLVEHEDGEIKGSLRSEPHKNVDVSKIAERLGGGGHVLASGFEVQGHIVQKDGKWRVIAPQSTIDI